MSKALAKKKDLFPQELPESQQGSGRGNEDVGGDKSVAMLKQLQKISPQMDPDMPEYIEGGVAGQLFNTNTYELYDEVLLINLYYFKNFAIFKKIDEGGGFEGTFNTRAEAEQHFVDNPSLVKDQHDIAETAHHFCVQIDEEGKFIDIVELMMTSTKLKISDQWNTAIGKKGGDRFSSVWKAYGVTQQAKNFSFKNLKIDFLGYTPDALHQDCLESYDFLKEKRQAA